MALEAIDLAKAGTVPGDLIGPKEDTGAGDENRLVAVRMTDDAVDVVDPVAVKRTVGEGNELWLVIATWVDWPGEVGVDGDNAIVWCYFFHESRRGLGVPSPSIQTQGVGHLLGHLQFF